MDLFVFILIAVIVYKFEYKKEGQYEDYLSKDYCICLKGICALLVLFHHLSQNTHSFGLLWNRFPLMSGVVGIFFFLSGYGLYQSVIHDPHYLDLFWSRRLPALLIPFAYVSVLYFAAHNLLEPEQQISLFSFLTNLFGPHSVVTFSWFVTAILLFYAVFYISARFFLPTHYTMFMALNFLGITLYYIVCVCFGFKHWWYLTAYAFPLGLFYSSKEKSFLKLLNKHFQFIFLFCLFLFLFTFLAAIFHPTSEGYSFVSATLFQIAYLFLPLLFIFTGRKVQFHNRMLKNLGILSLEIYLFQGLPILFFRNTSIWIENDFLFTFLVLCTTFAGAYLLHLISSATIKKLHQ